jgi:hypothetical protein
VALAVVAVVSLALFARAGAGTRATDQVQVEVSLPVPTPTAAPALPQAARAIAAPADEAGPRHGVAAASFGSTTPPTGAGSPAATRSASVSVSPTVGVSPIADPGPTLDRPTPSPRPTAAVQQVYYRNCTAARNAGALPLVRGEPGFRDGLDKDADGVACNESGRDR